MLDSRLSLENLEQTDNFISRHIGPRDQDVSAMLATLNVKSLDELVSKTVPSRILSKRALDLGAAVTEAEMLAALRERAQQNKVLKSFIGLGYYGTFTPPVILRNILENPGWYTAYTPYQAEISQGRLEALLNYQTMIMDLTGMQIANASMLDEGTAAAEAMHMAFANREKGQGNRFFVSKECLPQTLEVLQTRAEPLGIEVVVGDHQSLQWNPQIFAALVQYPTANGRVYDYRGFIKQAHDHKALVVMAADILSLALLAPPGELGADIAIGSTQRFGVPMGFGGPHAAYLATKDEFKRTMPGRLIGVSIDSHNQPALRLALQTREQHIRREKATSNICTAQVLLAVMASMYAVYHGPEGIKAISTRVHRFASIFTAGLKKLGMATTTGDFFDTVEVTLPAGEAEAVMQRALAQGMNLRRANETTLTVSFDETTTRADLETLWKVFAPNAKSTPAVAELDATAGEHLPAALKRTTAILQQECFNRYHSETEMLRYLYRLQAKDLSLTTSMIPLGSCTMKLNATSEMIAITWPEFANLHPFAPLDQAKGYVRMIRELEGMLAEVTGFAAASVQPNAGSQGEYTGLLVIRKYLQSKGEGHRDVCLIPSSAHGTNPASAVMAGMKVVVVKCDQDGNIDLGDLREKAEANKDRLAAVMVTYPSTHGVFEEGIIDLCEIVHKNGGQVYMDGANFNALVGLGRPGEFGPDVCHLNLHKTFCIPHGGGGPGVGPIAVAGHLQPYLPSHKQVAEAGPKTGISAVSAAPWGSATILPISWAYITLMGREGLKKASQIAILNANYIAQRLAPHFPILYKGKNGMVAHECIVDFRPAKATSGVEVEDVAKRLMDFGFHAPTMSWPVAGTLMIEPTESESKQELDRFCDALIAIHGEIQAIAEGRMSRDVNPLKMAPHTAADVMRADWDRSYSREQAAFPLPWVRANKFWPSVGRINNPYGDRNLVCACGPVESHV